MRKIKEEPNETSVSGRTGKAVSMFLALNTWHLALCLSLGWHSLEPLRLLSVLMSSGNNGTDEC